MNGNSLLLDTNIVLYLLNGDQTIFPLLENRKLYMSFITQLELLGYNGISDEERKKISDFINECIVMDINGVMKNFTIALKQKYRLKLPDAIIMATAQYLNISIITADRGFNQVDELDLILYEK